MLLLSPFVSPLWDFAHRVGPFPQYVTPDVSATPLSLTRTEANWPGANIPVTLVATGTLLRVVGFLLAERTHASLRSAWLPMRFSKRGQNSRTVAHNGLDMNFLTAVSFNEHLKTRPGASSQGQVVHTLQGQSEAGGLFQSLERLAILMEQGANKTSIDAERG